MPFTLDAIDVNQSLHCEAVAGLWTGACGPLLALSPRFVAYATRLNSLGSIEGRFAWENDEPIGAILVSKTGTEHGRLVALATLPESQGQGVATALLDWAEAWLADQDVQTIELGGGIRPFVSGLPAELESADFFAKRGYKQVDVRWDMAFNVAQYVPPTSLVDIEGAVYPARANQASELLTLLDSAADDNDDDDARAFATQAHKFVADKGRLSDYMFLWTERGLQGVCQLTFEDSLSTVEAGFPYQLPRAWGKLGSLYVDPALEGSGYAEALIDAGLRRFHNNGVNGCVVSGCTLNDSTTGMGLSVDLLTTFGFEKHREYLVLSKPL